MLRSAETVMTIVLDKPKKRRIEVTPGAVAELLRKRPDIIIDLQ
jgi:hypothetical protein